MAAATRYSPLARKRFNSLGGKTLQTRIASRSVMAAATRYSPLARKRFNSLDVKHHATAAW
jgi:hypothetical protein